MKKVKIVCIYDYNCPIPYDDCDEVPLSVCLDCDGLYVVKKQEGDSRSYD